MKIKSLRHTVGSIGCAAFLAIASAEAGPMMAPMDTGPVETAPISNLLDPIETTFSAGFDTHYMFRGYNLGEEAVWTGIDFSLPFADNWTLDFGAWYVNPTEGPSNSNFGLVTPAFPALALPAINANPKRGLPDDELDLYVGVGTTVGPVDISVGYIHYFLGPEAANNVLAPGVNDQNGLGINLGTSIGPIDLGIEYAYNFDAGDEIILPFGGPIGVQNSLLTHYWEPSIGTGFELTDRISLNLSAAAGFYSGQHSHYQFGLALPIVIAQNVTLEPYVAYLDDHKSARIGAANTDDSFFGGISLSVSF